MSEDTISRQEVIGTVHKIILGFFSEKDGVMTDTEKTLLSVNKAICNGVKALTSAQPEKRTEERTETHGVCLDTIDRQAALDWLKNEWNGMVTSLFDGIKALPSAQADLGKYEYHYDHTDCIWYRPEARNRCPATCAQYRDGWNDAMNYIFRDGEGYRPFRRDKKYEG